MEQFGPYVVQAEVARGGAGVVYRARHDELDRDVAIKVLRPETLSPTSVPRFLREARVMSQLRHPAIVRLYTAGDRNGQLYLVQEWIDGESLADRLERDPLPIPEAVTLTRELAAALACAHAEGILHRDVKPANVLLDTVGQPRLTDFGLARELALQGQSLSQTGTFLGTPGYWPPEQAQGELERLGPHSDVYGLGATLYAMLTQRPPRGQVTTLLEALTFDEPPPPPSRWRPEVPRALDGVVLRCLALAPEDRFPDMPALLTALDGVLEARPRRARALGVAALALCGLAGAGLAWGSHGAARPDTVPSPALEPAESASPKPDLAGVAALQRAHRLLAQGGLREAAAAYEDALAASPDAPWRDRIRARVGALRHMAELREGPLPASEAIWGRIVSALIAVDRRDFHEAKRLSELVLREAPDFVPAWEQLAAAHVGLGEDEAAVAAFSRAIEGGSELLRGPRAAAYLRLGDADAALADAQRVVEDHPQLPSAQYMLGVVLARQGKVMQAHPHLARALELDPDAPWAGELRAKLQTLRPQRETYEAAWAEAERAHVAVDAGRAEEALAAHDRALELARAAPLPEAHVAEFAYLRGLTRLSLDDHAGALADLDEACRLDATRAPFFASRAWVRCLLDDLEGAEADCDTAVRLEATSATHTRRAFVRRTRGNLAGALADAEAALSLSPGDLDGLWERHLAHLGSGHLQDALDDLRRIETLGAHPSRLAYVREWSQALPRLVAERAQVPGPDAAWGGLIEVVEEVLTRHFDAARDRCDQLLLDHPDFLPARVHRAAILSELGDLDAAIADLTVAIDGGYPLPDVWVQRCQAQAQAGRRELARADALQLVRDHPDLGIGHLLLGTLHGLADEFGPAQACLERALELDPDADWAPRARERLAECRQRLAPR